MELDNGIKNNRTDCCLKSVIVTEDEAIKAEIKAVLE